MASARKKASSNPKTPKADTPPWPAPIDGGALLAELITLIRAHVVLAKEEALAIALWILHTHAHDAAANSPILAAKSPEPRCGKTTLLKIIEATAANALPTSNITASAIFRVVHEMTPTLVIDEGDTFLKGHELRGILNSGHDRTCAQILRAEKNGTKRFSTWGRN